MKSFLKISLFLAFALGITSCSEEQSYTEVETSPVKMDLTAVPYAKLSDYNFFEGAMRNLEPVFGLIPYKPASELFTDYAEKSRFIWLPNGLKATYTSDSDILNLPVGAALVKSFYYNNVQPTNSKKIIETRLMIHQTDGWIFANYVWDDTQTEAYLQPNGSIVPITWTTTTGQTKSIDYKVPDETKCISCHAKSEVDLPIGIKPQNLNFNYSYPEGSKNQLAKLIEFGYLENTLPAEITSVVDYTDVSKSLELRVRSYVDINCAHCHRDGGSAEYASLRFPFHLTENPENMGICVGTATPFNDVPRGYLVNPGDPNSSLVHYALSTNNSYLMMPRIGRTIVHEEALSLIGEWINSLPACQ